MWWGDIKTLNIWKEKTKEEKQKEMKVHPIEELNLSQRAYNRMKSNNINTVGELVELIKQDRLKKIKGLGAKSINEIELKIQSI